MQGQADTYKETREFAYPNMTVRVHIPDLTKEQRKHRLKKIHTAAAELLKSNKGVRKNEKEKKEAQAECPRYR